MGLVLNAVADTLPTLLATAGVFACFDPSPETLAAQPS